MTPSLQARADEAIAAIDAALATGSAIAHADIRAAFLPIVALRDEALRLHREGGCDRAIVDRANSLLSLGYGALFPLSGIHRDRLEQARDALQALSREAA